MELKKGMRPGTEKRCALLHWLSEMNIASSTMAKILAPMENKTDPEKEQIAEEILNKLQNAKENGTLETTMKKLAQ